ncbi:MAG: MerR family transcriptional regulator [Cytophagales bacterium]
MTQQLLLFDLGEPKNPEPEPDSKIIEPTEASTKKRVTKESIEKKYYTIGEVAEMFQIAASSLRYWETEFNVIKPKKNRKGNRLYTKQDIDHIKTIHHLVKEKGYTIAGAKEIIKSNLGKAKDKTETLKSLEKIKGFLIELKNSL